MSTRCVIAAETESGIRGAYVHADGYPDGPNGKRAVLRYLVSRDGLSKTVATLLGSTATWASFDGDGRAPVPDSADPNFESVPGVGVRSRIGGCLYPETEGVAWDIEYVYLIGADGSLRYSGPGVTENDTKWSELRWVDDGMII